MVDFSYQVINEIIDAVDDKQVNAIIEETISTFDKDRRAGSNWKYMTNMLMALRYVRAEGLNANALRNVDHAIDIFEAIRKKNHPILF